ncbi:MAG TPA: iron-containing alcohol dehydrogenase, partial [Bacteroidales bacterium]|nr:iron-containing alcohol dehydrogenase [Bacteroidales bacterium]
VLSLICDIPHGASLSIAYIAWLKYHSKKASDKIQKLGHLLYRDPSIENTINNIEQFFKSIGCPINFKEANIDTNKYSLILNTMLKNKVGGEFYKLSEEDITNIFYLMSA